MRRMIMTIIMAVIVTATLSAQRIDNTIIEARILTEKMVEELGLNSWQREKVYQMNLDYLNGIHSYKDIDAQIWKTRNHLLKNILIANQWKHYRNASYFYHPISWREGTYVHNIYAKYPQSVHVFGGNRGNHRLVAAANPKQPSYPAYDKNNSRPDRANRTNATSTPQRNFGSMNR